MCNCAKPARDKEKVINRDVVKAQAKRLGFSACGLVRPVPVEEGVRQSYVQWLSTGAAADMHYLERHVDVRFNPDELLPGVQTMICVALDYCPSGAVQEGLAWYAQGKDYHDVVRHLLQQLQDVLGVNGRCAVDTAPLMEKYWAVQAGLGFIGRNTQLVIPGRGSAFFLGELLLTDESDSYDRPYPGALNWGACCGTCRRCLDACPTGALTEQGVYAPRCLSYLTIESRASSLPSWAQPHVKTCFYGCDRCLKACPHLRPERYHTLQELSPSARLLEMSRPDWEQLSHEQYCELFRGSAVKRARYDGLMRNIFSGKTSR